MGERRLRLPHSSLVDCTSTWGLPGKATNIARVVLNADKFKMLSPHRSVIVKVPKGNSNRDAGQQQRDLSTNGQHRIKKPGVVLM